MNIKQCDLGYTHYEPPIHKTYEQLHAQVYGIDDLSVQEARSWYNKIQKLNETKAKLQVGMDKALERKDVDLYLKLNDKWDNAHWEIDDLYRFAA
jgi:hypothetical protein